MAAYGIVLFYPASPIADELMLLHVLTQQVVFRAGLARSKAVAVTAATAENVFSLKHDGTEVATITFAAGQDVGTFTAAADFTIPGSGKFTIHAPATADATLANSVAATVKDVTKIRADAVQVVASGSLPNDGKVIEDARKYE